MTPTDPLEASVHGKTTEPGGSCEFASPGSLPPCTLVIFGASGDLTARKLIPAFYNLHLTDSLPEYFAIVGSSRTRMTHEEFREKLRQGIAKEGQMDLGTWHEFAAKLFYQPVTYDSQESFL